MTKDDIFLTSQIINLNLKQQQFSVSFSQENSITNNNAKTVI